jgi:hypothetical protein
MKTILLTALAFFTSTIIYAQCSLVGVYSFNYNGHSYYVIKDMKTWKDAAACAKTAGGYLVEINDTLENIAVFNAITQGANVSTTYTTVPDGGGSAYVWIGAHDVVEGTWIWDGDNDSIGINFYNGEGSNGMNNGQVFANHFVNWGNTGNGFNEPDNYAGQQDAAAIALAGWPTGISFLGSASQWNDLNPTNTLYYVIEKNGASGIKATSQVNKNFTLAKLSDNEWKLIGVYNEPELIECYDSVGRNVRLNFNGMTFNTSDLKTGAYIIKIVSVHNEIQYLSFVK